MKQSLFFKTLIIGAVVSCAACDEDPATDSPSSTDSDSLTSSDSDSDTGSGPVDTETSAPQPTDSDNSTPLAIFPHAVGNIWTYRYTALSTNPACAPGDWVAEITSMDASSGEAVYTYASPCKMEQYDLYTLTMTFDGDRTDVLTAGGASVTGTIFTEKPVAEGVSWISVGNNPHYYHWTAAGTITVEAGTFSDCWTRVETDQAGTTELEEMVFCRGIGRVSATKPGEYESELIDYQIVGQ